MWQGHSCQIIRRNDTAFKILRESDIVKYVSESDHHTDEGRQSVR